MQFHSMCTKCRTYNADETRKKNIRIIQVNLYITQFKISNNIENVMKSNIYFIDDQICYILSKFFVF